MEYMEYPKWVYQLDASGEVSGVVVADEAEAVAKGEGWFGTPDEAKDGHAAEQQVTVLPATPDDMAIPEVGVPTAG